MKRSRIALAMTFSISALFLTACNDNDDNYTGVDSGKTYLSETTYSKDKVENASSIKVMTYNMVNVQGRTAKATALVMFPKAAQPADGYRVVVWEHGTVGVADSCAPSNNAIGARFRILAESLLAAGYVVVAPDYEGLGTPGIHPYLNLGSEAKSAIAAVKAAKDHYGAKLNGEWMSAGQSQGGQASLGTAEYANADATYKGAVAGAPASSLGKIILEVAPTALAGIELKEIAAGVPLANRVSVDSYATLLAYAALTGVGIKAYEPRFNYRDIFQERAKSLAEFAEGTTGENGLCLDNETDPSLSLIEKFKADIIQFMTVNPDKKVMDYPGLDTNNFKNNETVQKFLVANQPGTKRIDKPVYIVQGTADTNVPFPVTQALVANLQALGSPSIKLDPVVNATHTQAIVCRNLDVYNFIQSKMPAKTNIVVDPAKIDASKNEQCTGVKS
ncbi:alpha/beta hydrolase [Acinetobacter proteolyticus]|uniref:Alpha/beta hydrolase n=1 Tax=Acinetobacter proteolyticus TaxID=1776741 RepID=A0A653K875_9GAMM|nr:lipase family protein [Acinetobacter proteolyticus]MBK5646214.1 alpha/beta hydrolase [Acinetobacter sp.]OEY96038.1 alpha/beta hydrolase [Acinetobacter proteolyticus]PKF31982.1 alpha/beta hydrolase [Acinetobacter proteolyticus]WEI18595.1 lipase family protein [Acinetobacter proteolyticus]VXA57136.1 Alpha/beta hydrolase [Acinetobacter proteolyticus]